MPNIAGLGKRELTKASKLSKEFTRTELADRMIEAKGNQKLADTYAWAIYLSSCAERAANGDPVPCNGYSGRKSNR